jgi:PIN domain nuclease of toxin-antitoxin system
LADTPLLLDTHVWLWYVEGERGALSPSWVELLEEARGDRRLIVSVISVWEVALLDARRRIRLSADCAAWVGLALARAGAVLAAVDADIAVASHRLPGEFHRDPVDQLLVATARHFGWTLVTRDRRILRYAESGHVRAHDAGARPIRA